MNIDIESIKRKLLVRYPSFGSTMANIKYTPNKEIDTAGTDGKIVYYNPSFISGLTEKQQIFVFAHEICHIDLKHITRSKGKDQKLWNTATDAVINAHLENDGLEIVEGGVSIKDAIMYDAEELYNKLLQEKQDTNNNKDSSNSSTNNNSNLESQSTDVGHDTHSMWDKAIKKDK